MDNLTQENNNESTVLIAIDSVISTLVLVFSVVCLVIFGFVVLNPKGAIEDFDDLGWNKASYAVYKRIYEKSQKYEDLYNVINRGVAAGEYKEVEKYAHTMLSVSDEFFDATDTATIKAIGKSKAVYMSSYKSYVKCLLVRAEYKNNKFDQARDTAISYLKDGDCAPLLEYIELIYGDERLSDNDRSSIILTLTSEEILSKIDELIAKTGEEIASTDDEFIVAVNINNRIKLNQIKYYIIKTLDESETDDIQKEINNLLGTLNATLLSMEK